MRHDMDPSGKKPSLRAIYNSFHPVEKAFFWVVVAGGTVGCIGCAALTFLYRPESPEALDEGSRIFNNVLQMAQLNQRDLPLAQRLIETAHDFGAYASAYMSVYGKEAIEGVKTFLAGPVNELEQILSTYVHV
ncbi:hypothetical protein JXB41_05745 [Candidatus Woesearchaeota archaeon]|nr:hypothetical protein [Candidatus Woesearchaeota archaeon]